MSRLPRGTVTLLFTDIEGSTELLRKLGRERYSSSLELHRQVLRESFARHGGVEVEMQGDSFHFAFPYARDAAAAAAEAQRELALQQWDDDPIRVRMGIHTGEPMITDADLYTGLDVHRAARVMSVAHGGQVLLSERTTGLVDGELPPGLGLRPLGAFVLKDFDRPEALAQLAIEGLPAELPPLRAERIEVAPKRRIRPVHLALVVAALAIAAGIAAALLRGHSASGPTDNAVVGIDPTTDSVVDRVAVGNSPTQIAAGAGGVWVVNADDGTVSDVDPSGDRPVRTIGASGDPTDVAAVQHDVWIADRPNIVLKVDPANGDIVKTLRLPFNLNGFSGVMWMTNDPGAVWVSAGQHLSRIDVRTARARTSTMPPPDWGPIAVAPDAVWESVETAIYRFDPSGRRLVATIRYPKGPLLAAAGFLWIANAALSLVAEIDPASNSVVRTVAVGSSPSGLAFGDGSIWVACQDGTVAKIDPETARVDATIHVGGAPQDVAFGYGKVWVAVA